MTNSPLFFQSECLGENLPEVESETGQDILTAEEVGIFQTLDGGAGKCKRLPVPSFSAHSSRRRLILSPTGIRICRRHDDQLTFRRQLETKIAIVATKQIKLLLG